MRVGGFLTILILGLFLGILWRADKARRADSNSQRSVA